MSQPSAKTDKPKPKLKVAIPPGSVGVASGTLARYTAFLASLTTLQVPRGCRYHFAQSCSVVDNCNNLVRELSGDWLLILGDDHEFPDDFLYKMLRLMYENDLDILAPLCLKRTHPWNPVVYDKLTWESEYHILDLDAVPDDAEVWEIAGAGTAGMLIRSRVFEKFEDPWFKAGALPGGSFQLAEDLRFCLEARDRGFKIHFAPKVLLGHISSVTLWADRSEVTGEWGMSIALGPKGAIFAPMKGIT